MVEAATPQAGKSESMEEILQSIKRIMDDNTDGESKPATEEVFELTNVVNEEMPAQPAPVIPAPVPVANSETTIKAVDAVFSPIQEAAVNKVAVFPEDTQEGLMSEQPAIAAASSFKKIVGAAQKDYSIPNIPSPQLRSGTTVEDLILEALRPMLKEWLDKNLPVMVQKIVEKEIKRIVSLHYD